MTDINEIMKMCDNALDLGDTENVPSLLELLRTMLETIYDFVEDTDYDWSRYLNRPYERDMAVESFAHILDVVEDF